MSDPDETYSDEEARRRFEAVVKRMVRTPPQPRRAKPKPDKAKARKHGKKRVRPVKPED